MIFGNSHWNLIQIFAASLAMSRNASNVTTYNALRHSSPRCVYIFVTLFLSSHALVCSPDVICPDVIYDIFPTSRDPRNILEY